MLNDIRNHLREEVSRVEDPRAQALFDTTAKVLGCLITAYEYYEGGAEKAWRYATRTQMFNSKPPRSDRSC